MNYIEIIEAIIFFMVIIPPFIVTCILSTLLLLRITVKAIDYVKTWKTKITRY